MRTSADLADLEGRLGVARMALEIAEKLLSEGGFEAELTDTRRVLEELARREGR